MTVSISRRELLAVSLATTGSCLLDSELYANETKQGNPFRFCLNTSTIRGQELGLVREIEIAAEAGYDSIEPWIREIDAYVNGGGSLKDLRKRIADLGLTVESAIGFAKWIVDDEEVRKQALETAKHDMDLLTQIGGTRIAAPPVGATNQSDLNLFKAAERYRALLELGDEMGIIPQVEVWGFSQSLARLGEAVFVAIESGHPKACLLPDIYHIYKGGSEFTGLQLLSGPAIHVFHINDYPAAPPRAEISDADRVYPGDGVAPVGEVLKTLLANGSKAVLSLELFNRSYWMQDPLIVAKTGLEKTKRIVQSVTG